VSQCTIPHIPGRSPDPVCNFTHMRSTQPKQASCSPHVTNLLESSRWFSFSSPISLFLVHHFPIIAEHKVMSSVSISPCHDAKLTPSTAYTEYSIHQAQHTPSTAYTKYSIHQVQHTPSTAYTENSIHIVKYKPSTAYTEYSIHRVQHTLSTVLRGYFKSQFQYNIYLTKYSRLSLVPFSSSSQTQSLILLRIRAYHSSSSVQGRSLDHSSKGNCPVVMYLGTLYPISLIIAKNKS